MYLLFDIGKTKFRMAVSGDLSTFEEPVIIETPAGFEEVVSSLKETGLSLLAGRKLEAIAGGIAAPLDKGRTKVVNSPKKFQEWIDKPFKERIEKELSAPLIFENDCVMAGLGEVSFGAGRSFDIVAYITVSTGVGGARFIGGKLDKSATGFEPGFQIINFDGLPCSFCKAGGHLHSYISGSALEKRYGKKPAEISDEKIWEEAAEMLAFGLFNTIVHWSPDAVVLGGSVMNRIPIERVRAHLKDILKIFPELPAIEKAQLGDLGGLYGAMAYLKTYYARGNNS